MEGWPFPNPQNLPNAVTELLSPALVGGFFTTEPPGKTYPCVINRWYIVLLGGSVVNNLHVNVGDLNLIYGLGRFPEVGNGNPLQHSCLERPMYRVAL